MKTKDDLWLDDADAGESDDRYWSSVLVFPDPKALSDEEMRAEFHMLDGQWSAPTQVGMSRFKAEGLELNENWALTGQSWACPACDRQKPSLLRLSKRGILLAKLDRHHDHFADNLATRMLGVDFDRRTILGERGGGRIHDQIRSILLRFEGVLVCSDCNTADGYVKTRCNDKIDSFFSFAPSEIAQFITSRPNAPHEIDLQKALAIWSKEKPRFEAREVLARQLYGALKDRLLAYDTIARADIRLMDAALGYSQTLVREFGAITKNTGDRERLANLQSQFLARSTRRDQPKTAPSPVRRERTPDAAALAGYVDTQSPRMWELTDEEWCCPACGRNRLEAVRVGKGGRLTGGIGHHTEYVELFDPKEIELRKRLFPEFPYRRFVKERQTVLICTDCRDVSMRLGQKNRSLPWPYLSIEDLRAVLADPMAHQAHEFDVEAAAARARINQDLVEADAALQVALDLGAKIGTRFDRLQASAIPEKDALLMVCSEIRELSPWTEGEWPDIARWLMKCAASRG